MMRWMILVVIGAGCGGDDGTGGSATDGGGGGGTVPFDEDLCDEIPVYDLQSLACDQLLNAFATTMSEAGDCNVDGDCQALSGQCTQMLNECFYPVSSCVDGGTVSAFVAAYSGCQGDDMCDCASAAPVECVAGRCEFVQTFR